MAEIFDPTLFLAEDNPGDTPADPDEANAIRMERQSIASKAGYNTWNEYTRAVGELKALQAQNAALDIKKLQAEIARGGEVSPSTIAQLAQSKQQFDLRMAQDFAEKGAAVVEEQRQFQEKMAFEKAKFDQEAVASAEKRDIQQEQFASGQALSREQLDKQRGDTLLGLGSRPDTLIRYLYALRGQQAPQQLGGVAPALPGYPGINALPQGGAPNVGVPSSSPAVSAAGSPPPQPALAGARASINLPNVGAAPAGVGAPNLTAQPGYIDQRLLPGTNPLASLAPAGGVAPTLVPQSPLALANQAPGTISINGGGGTAPFSGLAKDFGWVPTRNPLATPVAMQDGENIRYGARNEYAQGGVIPEHVVGVGQDSGQTYEFGEEGTEAVMSNDMLERLMAVAGKVDFNSKGSDGKSQRITMTLNGPPKLGKKKMPESPMNSYAAGGTIGYSGGKNDYNPQVFNPPNLSGIVGQGFNTPGIPLPPQVNMLTGGGQSLIPSAQTLSNALPSEVGAYSGFLTDEAGVRPEDVFALGKRLAPKVTGVRTPSYAG